MLTTMLRQGTERDFFSLVGSLNTGIEATTEHGIADRFFAVSLKLARAASRHARELRFRGAMPFKRGMVVGDQRTDAAHLPLADVLLPADHVFWHRWHPPFGMDCRCGALSMTRGQLLRSGRSITTSDALAMIEAQLRDTWPPEFAPLLDFRQEPTLVPDQAEPVRLTAEQAADVMRLFDEGKG